MDILADHLDDFELVPADLLKYRTMLTDDMIHAFGGILSDGSYIFKGSLEWASLETQMSFVKDLHRKYRSMV